LRVIVGIRRTTKKKGPRDAKNNPKVVEKVNIVKDSSEVKEFSSGMIDGNKIDKDIWIADSAMIIHRTSNYLRSVNEKSPPANTITLGNGQEELVERIVNI
jgi:hypothetical protein